MLLVLIVLLFLLVLCQIPFKYISSLIIEAIMTGIITVIVAWILNYNFDITSLFIIGFTIHIFCQVVGINTMYVKNGVATKLLNVNKDYSIVHPASSS